MKNNCKKESVKIPRHYIEEKPVMFRDVRAGDTLYVYDRRSISLEVGEVSSVRQTLDRSGMANGVLVDAVVGNTTYTLDGASNVGYTDNIIISAEKNCIQNEIRALIAHLKHELKRLEAVRAYLSHDRGIDGIVLK